MLSVGGQEVDVALPGNIKAVSGRTGIGPLPTLQGGGAQGAAEQAHAGGQLLSRQSAADGAGRPNLRGSIAVSRLLYHEFFNFSIEF